MSDFVALPGISKGISEGDGPQLLGTLAERAARPFERARALPAGFYTSPELYDLEVERIWRKSWIYVGRAEELQRPGDWMSLDVVGEPLMVVMGEDRELRAFSRVCRHRFMDLLANEQGARGHADKFVCPYHAWTYEKDGTFSSAPLMERSELFAEERESYCLTGLPLTIWQNFVFVNLDRDAGSLDGTLGQIGELFCNYDASEWRIVDKLEWGVVDANWKLAVDNGREGYHHLGIHKDSVEPYWPAHMVEMMDLEASDFWFGRMHVSPDAAVGKVDGHYLAPTILPAAPGLEPFELSNYAFVGLYPGFIMAAGPDAMFVLHFAPLSVDRHRFDIDILFHESRLDHPEAQAAVSEARRWILEVQEEDARAQAQLQRAVSTQLTADGGALSHLERPVWSFQRYLAKRLLSTPSSNGAPS